MRKKRTGLGDLPERQAINPTSTLKRLRMGLPISDMDFDKIFPPRFRSLSRTHWTPVRAAVVAAKYASARPGARVLDVGSGVGKFCIVGAFVTKGAVFHGVEQRGVLVSAAKKVAREYAVSGVSFFHANAESVDWKKYNAVYLYNPFWENLEQDARIDDAVPVDENLLRRYVKMTQEKLAELPRGTRAVIFNGFGGAIPKEFQLIHFERIRGIDLTVWEKS
jgi:hypothetical protein